MKLSKLLILCLFLSLKGFSQTPIISNITINQAWVDDLSNTRPWTISGSNVTVTFSENLVLNNASQYFIITGSNVTIDGARKTATISGVINYPGLVDASASNASSAIIKNIGVATTLNSRLRSESGYISKDNNRATISNCFSTGKISYLAGGIAGRFNYGSISNCYSSGEIWGNRAGGITGRNNKGSISNCFSTGQISGLEAGGIVGRYNYVSISNCYSSGEIFGADAGGIAGSENTGSITNSRTSGSRTDSSAQFIADGGTISNSENIPTTPPNQWNNTIANQALTGLGTIWNTSYTLISFFDPPTFANPGPITICQNGSYFLDPSTTNATWSSSNPSVATVDSKGYVTGLITGTTTISLENLGGTVTASVTVGSSSELSITDPLAQSSYKFNNNPQGPIGGTINYVGYNGFNYISQTRPINTGFYRASKQSGNESGCPYEYYIFRCTTCGTVSEYATRPQGTLTGNTIQSNGTGQLTYTSSNGGGPFTIVYQLIGGDTKTVTNVSSGQAFNINTYTSTTSYKLISVTDESTNAITDFSGIIATVSVVPPPTASLTGSQSICTGGTANLTLSLTGTGSITVTLNDGTAVTFNSGATSGIIPVTPSSARTYTISSVTDITGSGTSTGSSTVNFYAPASITVQPVSPITINEGTTTTLSVTATGQATLNYQWYQDGSAISGANSYSYTTTNTTSAAGTYYVTVSTTCNVVSSTTSIVSVNLIPQGSLTGSAINYGQTGQLTYTSINGSGPFTIVYQPSGGSNVTVTNVTSGVGFNVASGTPAGTLSYTLISVTNESTNVSRTSGFTNATATITKTAHYVGESFGGGIVFYVDGTGQHGLIAATSDQGTGVPWSGDYTLTGATGTAIGTGLSNTNTIITSPVGASTSYAAGLARAYTVGRYTDWYLPSKDELYLMYTNILFIDIIFM